MIRLDDDVLQYLRFVIYCEKSSKIFVRQIIVFSRKFSHYESNQSIFVGNKASGQSVNKHFSNHKSWKKL